MSSVPRLPPISTTLLSPSFPPRLFLLRHKPTLLHLSSILQTLSVLSPSSEFHSALISSLLSLLSLFRDLTPHHSYPPVLLSFLSSIQLPLEMVIRHHSPSSHLPFLTLLESLKLLSRLSLLSPRLLLTLPRQQVPSLPAHNCSLQSLSDPNLVSATVGPRSQRTLLTHANHPPTTPDPVLDALFLIAYERRANILLRALVPALRCPACATEHLNRSVPTLINSKTLSNKEIVAEVLYVTRPLVHVLLMWKWGWRSWRAWSIALVMDCFSRATMGGDTQGEDGQERRRRMAQLLLYFGRSPMLDLLMARLFKRLLRPIRKLPLMGGLLGGAVEWGVLLQQYWCYTSGS